MPEFPDLGHAQQAKGCHDIAQDNAFSGSEPGDRHTGNGSQHPADDNEKAIGPGQSLTTPMKTLTHCRQENAIGVDDIPAQTTVGYHDADKSGPPIKSLLLQSGLDDVHNKFLSRINRWAFGKHQ